MNPIEELIQKWIEDERKWRETLSSKMLSESFGRRAGYADMLYSCRRELQQAAGLVVKPKDVM